MSSFFLNFSQLAALQTFFPVYRVAPLFSDMLRCGQLRDPSIFLIFLETVLESLADFSVLGRRQCTKLTLMVTHYALTSIWCEKTFFVHVTLYIQLREENQTDFKFIAGFRSVFCSILTQNQERCGFLESAWVFSLKIPAQ